MATLQQQIADLRRRLNALPADAKAAELTPLEADARALLTASKNTSFEEEARAVFAELANRSARPAPLPESGVVRGIVRRGRIRMELAADESDYDAAIDILAGALEQDPQNADALDLLKQAAARGPQLGMKVRDLLARYGLEDELRASPDPTVPPSTAATTASAAPQPETPSANPYLNAQNDPRRATSVFSVYNNAPVAASASAAPVDTNEVASLNGDITQAYYAGDYQRTVELSNRLLAIQPDNPTALDYRAKSEDNLIRGIVPDHRIPFDARVAYNRANSLVRAGNYDEAARLYREARDIAERAGIPSWKDAEQALLDIQDLSLAREMLNDGDRLLATDDWTGALRKYEGAMRVVSSDPMAQERIDLIKRVQEQYDRTAVQLNMLSGSPTERAASLQNLIGQLGALRQILPASQKLQAITTDAERKLGSIRAQLLDQGRASLSRIEQAATIEDRQKTVAEAVRALELAASLEPGDSDVGAALQAARAQEKSAADARQTLERVTALIAQNFDAELAQARTMLANLREYTQDPRYRSLVTDLHARYMERVESALDRRNAPEAERWLALTKDEPFRGLGRRSELAQLEDEARGLKRQRSMRGGAIIGGIIVALFAIGVFARPVWSPLIFPPTPTLTYTPSSTPTQSHTPTTTATFTATFTPTSTFTPSATYTPSKTRTPTTTPTDTDTPTFTPTFTLTYTPSYTPTITPTFTATYTPTITPTPAVKCVVVAVNSVVIRSRPTLNAPRITESGNGRTMEVMELRLGTDDGLTWYQVRFSVDSNPVTGWVRSDVVSNKPDAACPVLP